jgi:hypothetical protein
LISAGEVIIIKKISEHKINGKSRKEKIGNKLLNRKAYVNNFNKNYGRCCP